MIRVIGEHPLAKDSSGNLRSRIATVFPQDGTIVTLPGIHATQRLAYVRMLDEKRMAAGQSALTEPEQFAVWEQSVDLIMDGQTILIRPDPENMELAFKADELLQELVSKRNIKFLHVFNEKVRIAIKRRGECWRINPLPASPVEMKQMIAGSKIGIGGREIYYYNRTTGTRFVTYQEFAAIGKLDLSERRRLLAEIKVYASRRGRMGHPEVDFFTPGVSFPISELTCLDFWAMNDTELVPAYESLRQKLLDIVRPEFRQDDIDNLVWRNHMFATLIGQRDDVVSEETLLGLSSEFFMQVEWLPGGRIEEGELLFDPVFEEEQGDQPHPECRGACDDKVRGFIFNFIREYGDLEYINIGRIIGSLSGRPSAQTQGRRDVFLAQIKQHANQREILQVIRMQKWGVREHLDEGKNLLDAMLQAEDYTDYILDRRLGCCQLGMNLPPRIKARRISERYLGKQQRYWSQAIWSSYFERDYIAGVATSKMPSSKLKNEAYALRFGLLLGEAAAPNMIVGRRWEGSGPVIFDDGDEVVVEDASGMPVDIVVSDHTGTFVDYQNPLQSLAPEYARAINRRIEFVADPQAFGVAFIDGFVERYTRIQQEYRHRKRAFDTLFKHRHRDERGSFAYRWEQILKRLALTNPRELGEIIRANLIGK